MFCVYVTIYSGKELPPFYIGHTSLKKLEEGYRGSPSSRAYQYKFKKELELNSHLFKTKIVSKHESRKEAVARERELQLKLDVVNNPLYINKSIADKRYRLTWKPSENYKKNLIRKLKNIPHTEEWNKKISITKTSKKRDDRTAAILRNMNKGKKWYNDGINSYLKYPHESDPLWKFGHLNGNKNQKGIAKHSKKQKEKWSKMRKGIYWRGL